MRNNVETAFGGTSALLALVERLYVAVQTPSLWNEVLHLIARHLGGESVALFAASPHITTPDLLTAVDMDPRAWNQYAEFYASINPIMHRAEQTLSPAQTWFSHAIIPDHEFERTEFHADFFQPNNMHYSVGLRLDAPGQAAANLSCQRPYAAGAFDAHADTILQTLRPHLVQVLTLRKHLGAMQAQTRGLQIALDAYDHAVLGVNATGCVTLCSAPAETMLRANLGLAVLSGRLVCTQPGLDSTLQRLLHAALALQTVAPVRPSTAGTRQRGSYAAALAKAGQVHAAGQSAMRLPQPGGDDLCPTVLPHRQALTGQSAHLCALVFLSRTSQHTGSRAALLTCLYGLTPTEARIADLLATGLDTAEIASRLRLTRETSRFYIKQILQKTDTRRQLDCLRLILSLPAL